MRKKINIPTSNKNLKQYSINNIENTTKDLFQKRSNKRYLSCQLDKFDNSIRIKDSLEQRISTQNGYRKLNNPILKTPEHNTKYEHTLEQVHLPIIQTDHKIENKKKIYRQKYTSSKNITRVFGLNDSEISSRNANNNNKPNQTYNSLANNNHLKVNSNILHNLNNDNINNNAPITNHFKFNNNHFLENKNTKSKYTSSKNITRVFGLNDTEISSRNANNKSNQNYNSVLNNNHLKTNNNISHNLNNDNENNNGSTTKHIKFNSSINLENNNSNELELAENNNDNKNSQNSRGIQYYKDRKIVTKLSLNNLDKLKPIKKLSFKNTKFKSNLFKNDNEENYMNITTNSPADDDRKISLLNKKNLHIKQMKTDHLLLTNNQFEGIKNDKSEEIKTTTSKNIFIKAQKIPKKNPKKYDSFALSKPGCDEYGKKKENQDTYLLKKSLLNIKNFDIFGIMDGHGESGHIISKYLCDEILSYFSNEDNYPVSTDESGNKIPINIHSVYSFIVGNYRKILIDFFNNIDEKLKLEDFDTDNSGTTCTLIIRIDKKLIISSIGDSKCIVVKRQNTTYFKIQNQFKVEYFTIDHKPNLPKEKERIEKMNGEVRKCDDEDDIYRLYGKKSNYPGLAISRTVGDFDSKKVGAICEPDFILIDLEENISNTFEKISFIVVASDGVWDYLSNEDVAFIGATHYFKEQPDKAAEEIIKKAVDKWALYEDRRDDISCVIYFL